MATLVVGGSHRGVGKTALVCGLIAALPEHRWIAVKVTSDEHGGSAPVWEETEAGQGSDTGRYMAAGAARAFLITASDGEIQERVAELGRLLGPEYSVIYESNRVADFVRPDALLLVEGLAGEQTAKASFLRIEGLADATVSRVLGDAVGAAFDSAKAERNVARPHFQLDSLERVSPQMREWVRQRIKIPHNPGGRSPA
jgi:molybdopterin-guanine dinucleotide biosynthesis protein